MNYFRPISDKKKAAGSGCMLLRTKEQMGGTRSGTASRLTYKADGEDVKVVQERLRHANRKITLDTCPAPLVVQAVTH